LLTVLEEKFDPIFAFEEYDDNKWIIIGKRSDEEDSELNATSIIPLTGSLCDNTIKGHDQLKLKIKNNDDDDQTDKNKMKMIAK
jgi:hypothetical protein